MPTYEELHAAAAEILSVLAAHTEFSTEKFVVIGGMAVWTYMRRYRTTKDIDFLVTAKGAPKAVKEKRLNIEASRFEDRAGVFIFKSQSGMKVQVDFTPDWQSPYLPDAATQLSQIQPSSVPYLGINDLIAFKINSCGLRADPEKKATDATDAERLLLEAAAQSPLMLTSAQKSAVEGGLAGVVETSTMSEAWWKQRLGL